MTIFALLLPWFVSHGTVMPPTPAVAVAFIAAAGASALILIVVKGFGVASLRLVTSCVLVAVSYTHLDVYKRQAKMGGTAEFIGLDAGPHEDSAEGEDGEKDSGAIENAGPGHGPCSDVVAEMIARGSGEVGEDRI